MGAGDGVTRRVFFAIDLDEASRAAIAELIERLSRRLESDPVQRHARVKWVERENLHMTVRFLGATPEGRVQELEALMGRPLSSRPFILGFDRVGTFPERGAPRVVWLGASIGAAEAVRARDELEERLGTIDVPLSRDHFGPPDVRRFRE